MAMAVAVSLKNKELSVGWVLSMRCYGGTVCKVVKRHERFFRWVSKTGSWLDSLAIDRQTANIYERMKFKVVVHVSAG
jgi:hypothetical protein